MDQKEGIRKYSPSFSKEKECKTCLYSSRSIAEIRDNCLRFARFVDHAINDTSRNCDYWTPSVNR